MMRVLLTKRQVSFHLNVFLHLLMTCVSKSLQILIQNRWTSWLKPTPQFGGFSDGADLRRKELQCETGQKIYHSTLRFAQNIRNT